MSLSFQIKKPHQPRALPIRTNYEWISGVSIGSFSNSSGSNAGYADYTDQTIDLFPGPNPISLSPGFKSSTYTEYWRVWIDLNQDDNFTSDEIVYSGVSAGALNGDINISDTALPGMTRMRVSMRWGGYAAPCDSFSYGEVEDYTVNINVSDDVPPFVSSVIPSDHTSDVDLDTTISVIFSEPMDSASINPATFMVNDGLSDLEGEISLNGNIVVFTPAQFLDHETVYTVTVSEGTMDPAGNPLEADYSWSFKTIAPDTTPPEIELISPEDNELDVDVNRVIQVNFNELMDETSINASTIIVNDGTSDITGTLYFFGKSVQFSPTGPYQHITVYTVTVTTGVQDLAGNPLQSDHIWSFTTGEYQPEYCTSQANNSGYEWIKSVKVNSLTHTSDYGSHYSDNTDTVFNLSRYFTNTIQLTPGFNYSSYYEYWRVFIDWNQDGTFSSDEIAFSAGSSSTINGTISVPANAWINKTRMRVSMKYGGWPEPCGNFTYGEVEDYLVVIDTMDTQAPWVESTVPEPDAEDAAVDTAISVSFSEAVDPATVTPASFYLTDGFGLLLGTVSYDGLTATLILDQPLNYGASYMVVVTNDVKDPAGNNLAAEYSWSFTTGGIPDTIDPEVILVSPEDGANDVFVSATISAAFSEEIDVTTMTTASFAIKKYNSTETIDATVSCDGFSATLMPVQNLEYDMTYTVTITSGVKDLAGNSLAIDFTWSFTTGEAANAVLKTVFPTIAAFGWDGGEVYGWTVDGVIDAFQISDQWEDKVYVQRYESLDFTKYIDRYGLYEFQIPAVLTADNINVDSAILSVDIDSRSGESTVTVYGYPGDGVAELNDFLVNNPLSTFSAGSTRLELDVTSFITSLIGQADFAGFIITPGSWVDNQYISFWTGLPHPAFGHISGQNVRLIIYYSAF